MFLRMLEIQTGEKILIKKPVANNWSTMTKMVLKLFKDLCEIIFHEICASDLFGDCIPEEDMYIL